MLKKLLSGWPKNQTDKLHYECHPVFRENSFAIKSKILCKEIATDMIDNYSFGLDLRYHKYIVRFHPTPSEPHGFHCGQGLGIMDRGYKISAAPEEEDRIMLSNALDSMIINNIDEQTIFDVMKLGCIHIALKFTLDMLQKIYNRDLPLETIMMLHEEIKKAKTAFGLKLMTLGISK